MSLVEISGTTGNEDVLKPVSLGVEDFQKALASLERYVRYHDITQFEPKFGGLWVARRSLGRGLKKGSVLIYSHIHLTQQKTVFRDTRGREVYVDWTGSAYKIRELAEYEVEEILAHTDFSNFKIDF